MANDCPHIEILAAYADHNLDSDDQEMLEAHLVKCYPCRKTIELTLEIKASISDSAGKSNS